MTKKWDSEIEAHYDAMDSDEMVAKLLKDNSTLRARVKELESVIANGMAEHGRLGNEVSRLTPVMEAAVRWSVTRDGDSDDEHFAACDALFAAVEKARAK